MDPKAPQALHIEAFFDEPTNTFSYVVADLEAQDCAIIDSVLDFEYESGRTRTDSAEQILTWIDDRQLQVSWILETHVHADHLSAAPFLKQCTGGKIAIGAQITQVQQIFGKVFNAGHEFARDGSQFDRLLREGDHLPLGRHSCEVLHTPGHTPACMSYRFGDAVFVGDTLFMPDYGTARCDFPGGDARLLYRSIQRLLALPPQTRLYLCHDYKAPGRDHYCHVTTVAEQRQQNIHIHEGIDEDSFVKMRTARDETLTMPRLILPSVQINMRAGAFPPAEDNGQIYLKLPLNLF